MPWPPFHHHYCWPGAVAKKHHDFYDDDFYDDDLNDDHQKRSSKSSVETFLRWSFLGLSLLGGSTPWRLRPLTSMFDVRWSILSRDRFLVNLCCLLSTSLGVVYVMKWNYQTNTIWIWDAVNNLEKLFWPLVKAFCLERVSISVGFTTCKFELVYHLMHASTHGSSMLVTPMTAHRGQFCLQKLVLSKGPVEFTKSGDPLCERRNGLGSTSIHRNTQLNTTRTLSSATILFGSQSHAGLHQYPSLTNSHPINQQVKHTPQ